MVAAGAHERRRAEVGLLLEAEHVAVEREALVDVADVQVQVAHPQAVTDLRRGLLTGDRAQQRLEVECGGAAAVAEVGRPGGLVAVGGQLDAVAVRVGQVDRLVRAVI